jgi:ankyrin repeat protein
LDSNGSVLRSLASNEEGAFKFDRVPNGNYKVEVTATAFKKLLIDNVSVSGANSALNNVAVELGLEGVQLMGVVVAAVEYEGEIAAAVFADDIEAVSNLIARGENVNKREEDRTTPLFVAVESGDLDMVRLLLSHGAKANARNRAKQTPIMGLDDDASVELVDLLLSHGAKVDVADEDGYTPLMIAAAGADAKVVSALITAGSRIDAQNEEGMSALMMAAFRDDVEVVKVLLAAGANVHLKDKSGETAWDQTGDEGIKDLLVAYGYRAPQEELEQNEIQILRPPHGG